MVIGTSLKILSFIAIGTIGSFRCGLKGILDGWMDWRVLDLQDRNYWIRDLVFLDVWSLGGLESSGRGFQIVSELVASPEVSKSSLPIKIFHQNPGFNCIFFLNLPRILTHWW